MIAVIYARYSDSKQTEQSIEGQLKVCYQYAEANGYSVLNEYIDRAQTGKTDDRTQFRKMLADSKKKQFDAVIVYALDRFGRNLLQALNNEKSLKDNGADILSATEHTENTASGRMQRNILMTFAQYYSDELAQKVSRGMKINAEKGLSNGGTTPLGYKIEDKQYVINEETAPIVKEIFTKYADDWSIKQICDSLNERQLKSARKSAFNKSSLHKMLLNRKYLGIYIYNGNEIPGGMPQIIDEELFSKVAEKMVANKKAPGRARAKSEYLLTTKLFCGYCKEMMIGHSANKVSKNGTIYNYYKCKNRGHGKPCKKEMVMKDYIEDIVVNECRKVLTSENIKKIAKALVEVVLSLDDRTEIERLESLLKKAENDKTNHMASLRACSDDTVREMIFEDLSRIGAEIKELTKNLELENARRHVVTKEQITNHLTSLADGDVNDIVYRRSLIRLLVNRIFLYDDKYTITFNSGEEEVTITTELLKKIEKSLEGKSVCLLSRSVHQKMKKVGQTVGNTRGCPLFLFVDDNTKNVWICRVGTTGFFWVLV